MFLVLLIQPGLEHTQTSKVSFGSRWFLAFRQSFDVVYRLQNFTWREITVERFSIT